MRRHRAGVGAAAAGVAGVPTGAGVGAIALPATASAGAPGMVGAGVAGAGVEAVAGAVVPEPGAAVAAGADGSWISTGVGAGAITVGESGTGATGRRGRPGRGRNRPVCVAFVSALAADVLSRRSPCSARAIRSVWWKVRPVSTDPLKADDVG